MYLKKTFTYRIVFIAFGIVLSACNNLFSHASPEELSNGNSQSMQIAVKKAQRQ